MKSIMNSHVLEKEYSELMLMGHSKSHGLQMLSN